MSRRSVRSALAATALAVPLLAAPAAPAQDVSGPCDPQQPQPGACVKEQTERGINAVRNICILREGKYCVVTLGDVIDRTLPPALD